MCSMVVLLLNISLGTNLVKVLLSAQSMIMSTDCGSIDSGHQATSCDVAFTVTVTVLVFSQGRTAHHFWWIKDAILVVLHICNPIYNDFILINISLPPRIMQIPCWAIALHLLFEVWVNIGVIYEFCSREKFCPKACRYLTRRQG